MPTQNGESLKQSNEIGFCIPLLKGLSIQGKNITADALLTQKKIAEYIEEQKAFYFFTVKQNHPTLYQDIRDYFTDVKDSADYKQEMSKEHGRLEQRSIRCTKQLNTYLNFPHVHQVYEITRYREDIKTGKESYETVYGITNRPDLTPKEILEINRKHWSIENSCHHILDTSFQEDKSCIRTGYGPENMTCLRRFAIGLLYIKKKTKESLHQLMASLNKNMRKVFDYLRMTRNTCRT